MHDFENIKRQSADMPILGTRWNYILLLYNMLHNFGHQNPKNQRSSNFIALGVYD